MNKHDWVVNVGKDLAEMKDYSREIEQPRKTSIYKVPDHINDKNSKAYKPQVVSLGPYHHGEENLKPMEVHKHRAFLHFLKRSGKPVELYWDALAREENDLKDAYDQLDSVRLEGDKQFLQMMIIDGCFILEILRVFTSSKNDYSPNDPIFSEHGRLNTLPSIKRDMLLLENQVPLRVLEVLVAVKGGHDINVRTGDSDLIMRIHCFFDMDTPLQSKHIETKNINGLHVLDVYRKTLLFEPTMPKDSKKQITAHEGGYPIITSATRLQKVGIRFKTSKTDNLDDISFKGSSTLCLPPIVVDDATKSLFLNLMAFERVHVGVGTEITAYVFFMGCLMKTGRDAELLRSHGIVQNELVNDEDVAQLFKSISRGVTLELESGLGIVYSEVITKVRDSVRKRLHAWRMDLRQNYLKSPWKVLSVIGAIILFTLTSIQTVYTVLSYKHKK